MNWDEVEYPRDETGAVLGAYWPDGTPLSSDARLDLQRAIAISLNVQETPRDIELHTFLHCCVEGIEAIARPEARRWFTAKCNEIMGDME